MTINIMKARYFKLFLLELFFLLPLFLTSCNKEAAAPDATKTETNSAPAPAASAPATNIDSILAKLPKGEVYDNVPQEMKVGVETIVEAGIAPKVTQKIKEEIHGEGATRWIVDNKKKDKKSEVTSG